MSVFAIDTGQRARAFTLVELLVVIAVIGILVGLLFPAIQAVRESSRLTSCKNNLRQISIATVNYSTTYKKLPVGGIAIDRNGNEVSLALHVSLLPLIEQTNVFDRFDRTKRFDSPENLALTVNRIPTFLCPTSSIERTHGSSFAAEKVDGQNVFTAHYYGVAGPIGTNPFTGNQYELFGGSFTHGFLPSQGLFYPDRKTLISDIKDGATNTLAFGEYSWSDRGGAIPQYRAWSSGPGIRNTRPIFNLCAKAVEHRINSDVMTHSNSWTFGSDHPGGASFSAVDGSVHFIAEDIEMDVYLALASINGSESIASFD